MKSIEVKALKGRVYDKFVVLGVPHNDIGVTDSSELIVMLRDTKANRQVIKEVGISLSKLSLSRGWLFISGKKLLEKINEAN